MAELALSPIFVAVGVWLDRKKYHSMAEPLKREHGF